jgi:hypothetical protein
LGKAVQQWLLFAQGIFDYEPLRRNRWARREDVKTGDGRPLPAHLKAQISRELASPPGKFPSDAALTVAGIGMVRLSAETLVHLHPA